MQWSLDQTAFDKLLSVLDPDRDVAGRKYESIRRKLADFFRWRGCPTPHELADAVIDRVSRKLCQGVVLRDAPEKYFHGVAINLLREQWRDKARKLEPLSSGEAENPGYPPALAADESDKERRFVCLERCIARLAPQKVDMLLNYHQGETRERIETRVRLADSLGIPLNALRIRVFRIRQTLEDCVLRCVRGELHRNTYGRNVTTN